MKKIVYILLSLFAVVIVLTGVVLLHPGVRKTLSGQYRTWRMSQKKSDLRTNTYGIDLSHHNSKVDWDKLEISFVYLKATEGASHRDSKYEQFLQEAKKRNIPVGAYHFLSTASTPEAQFSNFCSVVSKDQPDLIPVIDFEIQSPNHPISGDSVRSLIRRFSTLCETFYGKKPIIYSGDAILCSLQRDLHEYKYWTSSFMEDPKARFDIHQIGIMTVPGAKQVDVDTLSCPLDSIRL